jgi:hypothetical protein
VYEISICEPFVKVSSRRRKEISWGASPGLVGLEGRICEMWTARPRRVERTSRDVRDICDVNRSGGWEVVMVTSMVFTALRGDLKHRLAVVNARSTTIHVCCMRQKKIKSSLETKVEVVSLRKTFPAWLGNYQAVNGQFDRPEPPRPSTIYLCNIKTYDNTRRTTMTVDTAMD